MSVAGNLSDLTLTELLQTIALSRKSGTLEICSDEGVAWLGLREGGIVRVALSDADLERESVLKAAGLSGSSPSDEIEACLWEAAVGGILGLFDWREGEFNFSPDEDPFDVWRGPGGLVLPTSLSPEFLALEGARLEDETPAGDPPPAERDEADSEAASDELAEPETGGTLEPEAAEADARECTAEPAMPLPTPESDPHVAGAEREEPAPAPESRGDEPGASARGLLAELDAGDRDTPEAIVPVPAPEAELAPSPAAEQPISPAVPHGEPSAVSGEEAPPVLIAVDPELGLLEVIKAQLVPTGIRVHIFQRPEDGIERIKQYVIRGRLPVLLIGQALPPPGWRAFTERVRRMVPQIGVLLLRPPGGDPLSERGPQPDAVLRRYDLVREDAKRLIEYMRGFTTTRRVKRDPGGAD